MKSAGERLNATTRLLDSLSYERVLERGFAVVMDEKDKVISTASGVKSGAALKLRFRDGDAQAVGGGAKASKKKQKPPEQGQLF
jgi:exodeoxyribonuclease VII large subunit